jgi:regulator of protease activity HflC (stomatin/prohibitin superfamily)
VLGKADLDMLLSERETAQRGAPDHRSTSTPTVGDQGHAVEIKDVEIPSAMQRAMALRREAEREE